MWLNTSVRTCSLVPHLARHHCSGEQLVQLNQFVGRGVKLERNAVQRVPRFHLDERNKETEETGFTRAALFPKRLRMKDVKAGARFRRSLRNRQKPLEWNKKMAMKTVRC